MFFGFAQDDALKSGLRRRLQGSVSGYSFLKMLEMDDGLQGAIFRPSRGLLALASRGHLKMILRSHD
jgi:hypothetical protein